MKGSILLTLMVCAITGVSGQSTVSSANDDFNSVMLANIRQLDTASTASLKILADSFDDIANREKVKWQPFYYAAYCYAAMAFLTADQQMIEQLADKAGNFLRKAKLLEKNNSELSCLDAMIIARRLTVDPLIRHAAVTREVRDRLAQAKAENPDNPRIYLMEARLQLRTPEAFGGGKINAQKLAQKAVEKFGTFVPNDVLAPSWGLYQALSLLETISAN